MNAFARAAGKTSTSRMTIAASTMPAPTRGASRPAARATAASGRGSASAYLIGAVCGAALALPLAAIPLAAAVGVGSTPAPVATQQGPTLPAFQAHQVNRVGKGARLDLRLPAPSTGFSMMAKTTLPVRTARATDANESTAHEGTSIMGSEVSGSPVAQGLPVAPDKPTRASRPPRGCASTLGPVARLATDEITVCVASLS